MNKNSLILNKISSIVFLIIVPVVVIVVLFSSFEKVVLIMLDKNIHAVSRHIVNCHNQETRDGVFDLEKISNTAHLMMSDFELYKFRYYASSGEIKFSTDENEIGEFNKNDYFLNLVSKGETYSKYVKRDKETAEGEMVGVEIYEMYTPVMSNGEFMGAFEMYKDISLIFSKITKMRYYFSLIFLIYIILVLAWIFYNVKNLKKQAKEKCNKTREWEEVFNCMMDAVIVTDKDFNIINANKMFKKFIGAEDRNIIGENLLEFLEKKGISVNRERFRAAIEEKKNMTFDFYQENFKKWIHVSDYVVLDDKGDVIKLIKTIRDITDRKEHEESIKKKNYDLERFKNATIDRERKMIALKSELNDLRKNKKKNGK